MSLFRRRKSGIVNVRMVITEEKILSNIDKVSKLINPNSKKQIVQLEEDTYFKDLIESIKMYLVEYPKKKNFPKSVYKASYDLVEYATDQFEENTKQIEDLIRQREKNIIAANELKDALFICETKEKDWKNQLKAVSGSLPEDIVETLTIIGRARVKTSENYENAVKLINARIANLESNLHIEIDMERIEDRSKALSYIGIEVAEALKGIPTPIDDEETVTATSTSTVTSGVTSSVAATTEEDTYVQDTTFEVKPSLWQRIKNSKVIRAITNVMRLRIKLELPALPEGRDNK